MRSSSCLRQGQDATAHGSELRLDLSLDVFESFLVDEDLDARLVLVVAPPIAVVDAQDALEIGEQVRHAAQSH